MSSEATIGIVGGVGPSAGLDLARKVFRETLAGCDQEHLPVVLISRPGEIVDRTGFLEGQTAVNPAYAISRIIGTLESIGASVVGIPCNTAHAPPIFDVIREELGEVGSEVKLVHMIDEVSAFLRRNCPRLKRIGLLATRGTYRSAAYSDVLEATGIHVLSPNETLEGTMHNAIYDPGYGIKAQSEPVTETARQEVLRAIRWLERQGAEAVVLGCTELPLAVSDPVVGKTRIIDPTLVLARALIRESNPRKLRPLPSAA